MVRLRTNKEYEGGQYVTVDAPIEPVADLCKKQEVSFLLQKDLFIVPETGGAGETYGIFQVKTASSLFMRMREITTILKTVLMQQQSLPGMIKQEL